MGAVGHKFAWYAHVVLSIHHGKNALFIVPGFLAAWVAALEEAVIALRIEQAMLVESRALEAVINVGGEHEVITAAYEFEQFFIDRFWNWIEAVARDVSAPKRPMLFKGLVGIESACIHIAKTIFRCEVAKKALETLTCICVARCGGKPCARAYYHGVGRFDRVFQFIDLLREALGRLLRQTEKYIEYHLEMGVVFL